MRRIQIGIQTGGEASAHEIRSIAAKAEALGFDEVWVIEDYFYTGGIAGILAALDATSRIKIGSGILATQTRHPAVLAMEAATIMALHPGRFHFGIGLGVMAWLRQMGLAPRSPMNAMRECVDALRALLNGDTYSKKGEYFEFNDVRLIHPPKEPVPIHIGAMNTRMIELTGAVADGLVAGNTAGPELIKYAKRVMRDSAMKNDRDVEHRVTCYVIFSVDHDGVVARKAVRPLLGFYLAVCGRTAHIDIYGYTDQVIEMFNRGGIEFTQKNFPDAWLSELVVAGTPRECADQIERFRAAGVDCLVLFPQPAHRAAEIIEMTASEVFPLLS